MIKIIYENNIIYNLIELLKIIQCILSISLNNSYVEEIFSIVNNILNNERNRLKMKLEKTETFNKWIMIWNVKRERGGRERKRGGKEGKRERKFYEYTRKPE